MARPHHFATHHMSFSDAMLETLRSDVEGVLPAEPGKASTILLQMLGAPMISVKRERGDPSNVVPVFFVALMRSDAHLAPELNRLTGAMAPLAHFVTAPRGEDILLIPFLFDRLADDAQFVSTVTSALETFAGRTDLAWFHEECHVMLGAGGYIYHAERVGPILRPRRNDPLGLDQRR